MLSILFSIYLMTLPKKNPTLSPNFYIWTVYTCPTFASSSSSSELYSWQALMPQHYKMNSSSNNRRRESGPWAHPSWALKALVGLNMIRYGECSSLHWLQIQQRGAKFSLSRCWWELYKFNEPSTTTYTYYYIHSATILPLQQREVAIASFQLRGEVCLFRE